MSAVTHSQPISEFSITALHGERNITIPFDGPVKIIVAENGFGKTTTLNSIYAILFGNYEKLRATQFRTIGLKFKSGKSVLLNKADFALNIQMTTGLAQHFKTFLTDEQFHGLLIDHSTVPRGALRNSKHFNIALALARKRFNNIPDDTLVQWLEALKTELGGADLFSDNLRVAREIISDEFPFDSIYLPTYRRVEEDLRNLIGFPLELDIDKNVIKFGMNDVQASFDQITTEIRNSSVQWFAKINGQMLGQLIKGMNVTDEMKKSLRDQAALKIVLERIGDNIDIQDKTKILDLIKSEAILENESLAYFLANLVKVYEQQKDNDNAIKRFIGKCNKYLVDKHVVYDESAVDISIKRKKNGSVVDIQTLSSGEKQIISLFSRLFLANSKNVAIFFDEPELSLSIEWQKQLLPDIIESGICSFLFCTTHSPFIFDNDLAQYTVGLDKFIEEL